MNEYVQKYLEQRNAQKKEEHEKLLLKVMNNLKIGEREYSQDSNNNYEDFPYWDADKGNWYRYNAGEISEEEFNLIVQDVQDASNKTKLVEKPERSGWYAFATFIMILSGIGLFILAIVSISEANAIYFLIGLGEFLMISLFCGILQLLAGIKLGIDNLQNR